MKRILAPSPPRKRDVAHHVIETFKREKGGKAVVLELKSVGIYKLDGDKLTLCYVRSDSVRAGEQAKRPREFRTGLKSTAFLRVFEREKP